MGGAVEALWLVVLKLAIYPLLAFILVAKVFALDPLWGQALVVLSAMPIGPEPSHRRSAVQRARSAGISSHCPLDGNLSVHDILLVNLAGTRLNDNGVGGT